MDDIEITSVPAEQSPQTEDAFASLGEVETACAMAHLGHTDLISPPQVRLVHYLDQRDSAKQLWLARDQNGQVVGWGSAAMALNDNLDTADVHVEVHPGARGRGVGTALAAVLRDHVAEAGRHVLQCYSEHLASSVEDSDPDTVLVAPTGVGALRRDDPAVRFALARGLVLEQTERHSQLDLPVPTETLAGLAEQAAAASDAEAYELLSWVGATPAEHRTAMVALLRRMSVDVPSAALESQEQAWDVDRLLRSEERTEQQGFTVVTTAARHRRSGALVAYTVLEQPADKPEVLYQGDTLVHGDHRGHRLGLAVKLANHEQAHRHFPAARRVHTWNAGENAHMLAINVALGFRAVAIEGVWQLRLPR